MPERFEAYLARVCAEIRWKRAHPILRRELRTHLEEQKADCLAAGMTEAEAENEAIRQMGDPVLVGRELDDIHRPKTQWGLLCLTALLAVLGTVFRLHISGQYGTLWVLFCLAISIAALLCGTFFNYHALGRYAGPLCLVILAVGCLSLAFPYAVMNGRAWPTAYVAQLFPLAYALGVYALRDRGWGGFAAAALLAVPFAAVGCRIPSFSMVLAFVLSAAATLFWAVSRDWFRVRKSRARTLIAGAFVLLAAFSLLLLWRSGRLLLVLHPELDAMGTGYQGVALREALRAAAVWGPTAADVRPFAGSATDHILTEIVLRLGLVPAILLCLSLLALFAVTLVKCLRQRNGMGGALALSAAFTIGVRMLLNLTAFTGIVLFEADCPFLSGNFHSVIDMALMGLALSVFRQAELPEPCRDGAKTSAGTGVRRQDGTLTVRFR